MNNFCQRLGIGIIFILLALPGAAQKYSDDSQLWMYLSLEKKVNKKFDVHLKLQSRFTDNITEFGRAYADVGIGYKIHNNIKLIADYVYTEKRSKSGNNKTRHTYYAALIFKKDIRRIELAYRNLFMCRYKDPFTSYEGYIPYFYDRNKLTVSYEISKRFTGYIAGEINIPLNNPQLKGISRLRTYAGVDITVKKHQKLELYFMNQLQLQQGDWFDQDISYKNKSLNRYFVLGVGYSIVF